LSCLCECFIEWLFTHELVIFAQKFFNEIKKVDRRYRDADNADGEKNLSAMATSLVPANGDEIKQVKNYK